MTTERELLNAASIANKHMGLYQPIYQYIRALEPANDAEYHEITIATGVAPHRRDVPVRLVAILFRHHNEWQCGFQLQLCGSTSRREVSVEQAAVIEDQLLNPIMDVVRAFDFGPVEHFGRTVDSSIIQAHHDPMYEFGKPTFNAWGSCFKRVASADRDGIAAYRCSRTSELVGVCNT